MAVIGFFVLPNTGSMNACLKLAMDLRERGHEVCYLGLADSEDFAKANGFAFTAVFENYFPKAFYAEHSAKQALPSGWRSLRDNLDRLRYFKAFFEDLMAGGDEAFLACLRALRPDLLVFASGDPYIDYPALMAYSLGIKGVYFHSALWSFEESGNPPLLTGLFPATDLWQWLRVKAAWQWYYLKYASYFWGFGRFSRRLAARYAYPLQGQEFPKVRNNIVRLPVLLPFPPEFDFPHRPIPCQYPIEASICPARKAIDFPWERLDASKPLAYCALGTYLWFEQPRYRHFFRALIEASAVRPDWQWVIAIGEGVAAEELAPVPANVILVKRAPQLDLLKRARIMVSHGGSNSIKECIYFGVPVLVFPLGADQPGYAARVAYHGIGLRGDMGKVDAGYLRGMIDALDRDTHIRSQMAIMRQAFLRHEEDKPSLRIIEAILAGEPCQQAN